MGLLDRIRGEGAPVETHDAANGLVDRLGSFARRGGQLAGRVAEGVKEATPKRLLRDAIDAQARGNIGAAYYLARESIEAEPGDPEADGFFWDVAIAYGEPGAAADSAARLVGHHAAHDAPELAAQYFRELVGACEPALVEPSVLVRLLPELVSAFEAAEAEKQAAGDDDTVPDPDTHRMAVCHALTMCVHPENSTLSPGLAMRVAELARPFDPEVALEAAHRALSAENVHEAKRAKLISLIRDLDPDAELDQEEALEVDPADLAAVSIDIESDELSDAAEVRMESDVADAFVAVELQDEEDGVEAMAAIEISDAEADRIASFLEPAEDELEAVTVGDITESEEVDMLDVLPELEPIDDSDPSRNHPSRVDSPIHEELSEDDVDRARARIESVLSNGVNAAAPTSDTDVD